MRGCFKRFLHDDEGATSIEYALIAVIIASGLVFSLNALPGAFTTVMNSVSANLVR